ncbi:hypothetical protein R1flu_016908 [Riccia fluitans]|uniref:Uncharacterized protein n=1 Tax=Riccia fluitans TaxID=41844 RepID=A0ABD1YN67_9MARC
MASAKEEFQNAEILGLSVIWPCPDAVKPDISSKIMVGSDHGAVLELKKQMEEKVAKQMEEKAKVERQEREAKARKLEALVEPGKGALKDVVGEWQVQSPAICDQWSDHFGTDFRMSIYFHKLEELDDDSDEERSYCSVGSYDSETRRDTKSETSQEGIELLWANFEMGVLS